MKPSKEQIKGYRCLKTPEYKSSPAKSTEGEGSKAKIPAHVTRFNKKSR